MKLIQIPEEEFNTTAEKFNNKNFFQTSNMGKVLKSRGKKVYYLGLSDDNGICAVTMLSEYDHFLGKIGYACLKGFLINYEDEKLIKEFTDKLAEFVKDHDGYRLVIDPYIVRIERDIDGNIVDNGINNEFIVKILKKCRYIKSKIDVQVRTNFCLNLENKSENQIFTNFKSTTRNLINKAMREGVEVLDIAYDDLPRFKRITEYTSNKRGFKDRNLEYYQEMYKSFKDKVVFKIARLNVQKYIQFLNKTKEDYLVKIDNIKGENKKKDNYLFEVENINKKLNRINDVNSDFIDLSAAMFMLYGDETIYLFSGSYDEYNEFAGQYLIQWDIIKYAIRNNYKRHNFFGILNYTDKQNPDYGIYLFKRGFDGYVEELLGEYYLPIGITGLIYKIKNIIRN